MRWLLGLRQLPIDSAAARRIDIFIGLIRKIVVGGVYIKAQLA